MNIFIIIGLVWLLMVPFNIWVTYKYMDVTLTVLILCFIASPLLFIYALATVGDEIIVFRRK